MTRYIREQELLPPEEIDRIAALAPPSLTQWQDAVAQYLTPRPEMRQWLDLFDAAAAEGMRDPPTPTLYSPEHLTVRTAHDPSQSACSDLRRTATA